MKPEKLIEFARKDIALTKGGFFRSKWKDSVLSVTTDTGLCSIELMCNLQSYKKDIESIISHSPCPSETTLTNYAKICSKMKLPLLSADRNMDPALWICNSVTAFELNIINDFEWCPYLGGSKKILAVLTSNGCIEIYTYKMYNMCALTNLTALLIESQTPNVTSSIEELKSQCERVQSSSFCWGSCVESEACLFVTAQRDGSLIIWKMSLVKTDVNFEKLYSINLKMDEIKTMSWINDDEENFSIVFTLLNGTITLVRFKIADNNISTVNNLTLWSYKDSMVVKNVCSYEYQDKIVYIATKHRHLLVFLLNKEHTLINSITLNINDYTITGLNKCNDSIYLATDNFRIYKLNIKIDNDLLALDYHEIFFTKDYSEYILHDVCTSSSNAILTVIAISKYVSKMARNSVSVLFFKSNDCDYLETLIKNPTEKLSRMWDCIEILRIQFLKEKPSPTKQLENVFSDSNLSMYLMKLYLILWKLYEKNKYIIEYPENSVFVKLSPETIKNTLLMKQAVSLISSIYHKLNSDCKISNFEHNALRGCYIFANFFCNKYNYALNTLLSKQKIEFASSWVTEFVYKCQYCEAELKEYLCENGHPNMFCSLTLQPITDLEYLSCKLCNSTAHKDLKNETSCLFCDVVMEMCV